MYKKLLVACFACALSATSIAQATFNPLDSLVRWDTTKPYGAREYPDTNKPGLQKWVSVATNSISTGYGAFDVSSYKAYFINVGGRKLCFRLKFPYSYNNPDSANKKYPVMLFFHGAGEPGCPANGGIYNNEKQLLHGGQLFRDRVDNNQFDGFLFYPQVLVGNDCSSAWPTANDIPVLAILDSINKYARGDIDRLFVAGLSDGGRTTWRFTRAYPQRVAKIAPSSMSAMTTALQGMIHIPVWFASGGKDSNPSPESSQQTLTTFKNLGGDIRYTLYPELGHAVWDNHWTEPDFLPYMNDVYKSNPLVFFLRNEWCPGQPIAAKLGLTAGFYAYEWQKDSVTIATTTNGVNKIVVAAAVTSYTGNEITVKQYGTYRVRFKRTATSAWSLFSLKPIVIKTKLITQTAPIQVVGKKSVVLPALDGSTTVPLTLANGFLNYRWYRASDNVQLATTQMYNAPVGTYKAKYDEQYGCGSNYSPNFIVANAAGIPKPPPATTLQGTPVSQTVAQLNWTNVANPASNETGFEIYRATTPGGPYTFINTNPADSAAYTDSGLTPNTSYYYVVRAVNTTGAAAKSNEAAIKTLIDNTPPTAPVNVRYAGSTPTSVALAWNAATDNINIKRYDIYINGVKTYSTTDLSFTVNGLDSLKWYAFTIKAVDGSNNQSAPSSQMMGYTHQTGLNFKYYNGSFTSLPDFSTLTPNVQGITPSINTGSAFRTQEDNYAILYEGYVYVPVTANYIFATNSDEGSRVYIDMPYSASATPLVDNDGVHPQTLKYNLISLTKGYHQIAVSYFEASGPETMGIYWTNDAGLDAQEIPTSYLTPTNVAGIPPLIAPSDPTATALSYNKIKLTWTDNSSNETGFEILHSTASGGPYIPAGRVAANQTTFTDSALSSATSYYYQVRSIGTQSESPYTTEIFETTMAAPGTPVAPGALVAQNISPTFIALNWIDNANNETNLQVWRSADEKTSFQLVGTLPINSNSFTDNAVVPFAQYYYYVVGVNGNGNGNSSDTLPVIAGNNAPVVSAVTNMFVKTDATASQNFVVTDPGDSITMTIDDKPSFVNIQKLAGNNYKINVTPTVDNIGWFNLKLRATDSKGASTVAAFVVSVADKNTRSVYVNFGSAAKTAPSPWNNWLGTKVANAVITNLKDENKAATAFSVTTLTAWSGLTDLGHITGNNSGVYPDSVLQSGLLDNGTMKQLRVGGLNPAMRYNLVFVGSQNEGLDASTQYTTGTQSDTMNARYNTNTTANLNTLTPNASGQITVNITRLTGSLNTYLNAMVIEEYAPAITVLNPLNLFAETVDRNNIKLTWSDRTNNENAADGYELTRATDSLFTANVVVVNLQKNTTAYKSAGLNPNTKYWFRVRAKAGVAYSGFSNRASAITPASVVYVNFNATVVNAPLPWNNTQAQPTSPTTFSNLLNQAGANTGLSLRIEKIFNGEFNAGAITGNNSGVVPDNVLKSDYWVDKTQLSQMRLTGLNFTKRYRIGFIGSSGPAGWYKDNYTATYSINGKTVYLNSWGNNTKIVYINDVSPDENGEMLLSFSTTAAAAYGFNAGVIIEEYDATLAPDYSSNMMLLEEPMMVQPQSSLVGKNRIYPNPFHDVIMLDYFNDGTASNVSAFIYDISGRLVNRTEYNSLVKGYNQLRVDTRGTALGSKIFTVVLATKGKVLMVNKMIRK